MTKLTAALKDQIIGLISTGSTISFISKTLKLNKSTVFYFVKRWRERYGNKENLKSSGRPKKLTSRAERKLIRLSTMNPKLNATDLSVELRPENWVSTSLVRKILIKHNLMSRIALRKPMLTAINVQKRRRWCREKLTWPVEKWNKVIFSDETIIELYPKRREYVRRPPGKGLEEKYLTKTAKFGGKRLMLWGFIKSTGERGIFKITKSINSDAYIEILQNHLLDNMFLDEYLQQDNAPAHNSMKTRTFMDETGIQLLENWPPQSPDLNIIENLWSILKIQVARRSPRTVDELWRYSKEEFFKIPNEYIKKLFDSIPRRLKAVLVKKGKHTKY